MRFLKKLLFINFFIFWVFTSHAQIEDFMGNSFAWSRKDSAFSINFGFRMQNLVEIKYAQTEKNWQYRAHIRRTNLGFNGFILHPSLTYKLTLALNNSSIGGENNHYNNYASGLIRNALLIYEFHLGWSIMAGQTNLPGNRESLISSRKLQIIDRSLISGVFGIGKDIGIQLYNEMPLGASWITTQASVAMGEGDNITINNKGGLDYTLRLEYLPWGNFTNEGNYFEPDLEREPSPKLAIAGSYDFNNKAVRTHGNNGPYLQKHCNMVTYFADAIFKYRGFSLMMEWSSKKPLINDDPENAPKNTPEPSFFSGYGLNCQGGYLIGKNWEIAGRYEVIKSNVTPEYPDDKHYTIGFSKYIWGNNLKFQNDFTLIRNNTIDKGLLIRTQFEVSL